mmetsp:Transcript_23802/g.35784  ORF Transcript_23802/g.35784 Transcript_23802/m.35784 type:complete len:270 (+) Transcript_23802:99-908(+)
MVKIGAFNIELVAADTKEVFKEHIAPDGQVYAEVEPGVDYFISTRTDVGRVRFEYSVDGVNLGYGHNFGRPSISRYAGSYLSIDGKQTMTALHFNKTREAQDVTPDKLTGKIKARVYTFGEEIKAEEKNFVTASLTADSTLLGGKKCIKSTTSGSYSFELGSRKKSKDNMVTRYKRGTHICTLTLNYCSALGLIYNRILPPPPALQESGPSAAIGGRKKRKRSTTSSHIAVAAVSPEVVNNSAVNIESIGQERVTVQLTYDFVDLTGDD